MDIYLLCLIVGGGLFAVSLLGGHDAAPGEHAADHLMGDAASWFTLRALVSFVAFFGLAGVLGGVAGVGGVGRLAMALICGLAVGTFTSWAFRVARTRGEVGSQAGKLAGRTGTVIVPPRAGQLGKVSVTVSGQIEQARATSHDLLQPGDPVIVIGEERGVLDVKFWDGA